MRFVKREQGLESPEATAFGARLTAIAARGKAEGTPTLGGDEPLTETPVQRRFWTPDEIPAGAAGE